MSKYNIGNFHQITGYQFKHGKHGDPDPKGHVE